MLFSLFYSFLCSVLFNKEYYLSFFLPSQACRSGDGTSIPGSELTRTRLESGFLPFQSPVLPQGERNILNRSLALTVQRQRFKLEAIVLSGADRIPVVDDS